ncbi:hypothetical protein [Hymenobacter glacieicola]|uniref:Uncharacterized protein n=1 Tax=Hymenobacter glacieicola TaxID=1562124 RepID=A0ABQ1X691_9BACT|nr:hypothetical protein [Hymenobacter glacieicola]GGG60751.1 hypothetical protein GCM10011378_40980 [Hymenobacter glacieicola]
MTFFNCFLFIGWIILVLASGFLSLNVFTGLLSLMEEGKRKLGAIQLTVGLLFSAGFLWIVSNGFKFFFA